MCYIKDLKILGFQTLEAQRPPRTISSPADTGWISGAGARRQKARAAFGTVYDTSNP
ncbi:hypothetical protein NITGR_980010 [Nitrospina gracilis 3/211]|uniref:Uncharacterized protein n=1 Tax=Nitrospina gracilis (strain 3/211) TaxID=1266370 RepID=M1Z325_NITG3|nr:hypothetical protein [Nitrospina sp. Nb-3]MCF8722010.1 hypothetical protein [Nitrospina sp. Nb-3]CCQ92135.1 hypothetical protein NITGR_980010 [Nitrospina gracilis 3/211]